MPNTFTDKRDRWLQMSEIDYLGQLVKAWLAFNAWYMSAYTATQDRNIMRGARREGGHMRAVIQRVSEASVTVEGAATGAVGRGLLVLLGGGTAARPRSSGTRANRDKKVDYSRFCGKVRLVRGPAAKEAAP